MSKLTSNQVSQNSSKLNISNITSIQKKKAINYQEIISLKKLLKHEVREAKGQELVNTYKKSKYIHKLVPCISLYSSYRDILDIKELNKYVKEYIDSDKKREEVQEILTKYRVDEFDLNTK